MILRILSYFFYLIPILLICLLSVCKNIKDALKSCENLLKVHDEKLINIENKLDLIIDKK